MPFDSAVAEATQRVQEWLKLGIVELCGAKKLGTQAYTAAEYLQELRSTVELLQKALAIDVAWIARE